MKVVMICELFNENLEYQENLLLKYYLKIGVEVVVIAANYDTAFEYYADFYDKNRPERDFIYSGARIVKRNFTFNYFKKVRKLNGVQAILQEEKPDIIYVHSILFDLLEAKRYVQQNPACKLILDYHADYSNSGKNKLSLLILHKLMRKQFVFKPSRKYIHKIFPVVPSSARFLNEIYDVPLHQMEILPLGADYDLVTELKQTDCRNKLRNQINANNEDVVIITGGKLQPQKQTELLIQAVNQLNNKHIHLLIIGKSAENDGTYFQTLIDQSKQNANIHFVGWLAKEEVYKHLLASDLAVFPASQSILWQQAISAGLPLIAGDIGDQSIEYLNKHQNIIILSAEQINAKVLEENIKQLYNNRDRLHSMSAGAKLVSENELNWNQLVYKTLQ